MTHPHKNSPAWQRNLNHMKGLLDWNEEIFRDHLFFYYGPQWYCQARQKKNTNEPLPYFKKNLIFYSLYSIMIVLHSKMHKNYINWNAVKLWTFFFYIMACNAGLFVHIPSKIIQNCCIIHTKIENCFSKICFLRNFFKETTQNNRRQNFFCKNK